MNKISICSILIMAFFGMVSAQTEVQLHLENSKIEWLGSKLLGFGTHHGTVKFTNGKLFLNEDKIQGGNFTIDMNTIADENGDFSNGLVNHLKDPDFFDVSKYPSAHILFTDVAYIEKDKVDITANLTIKGISNPIKFSAKLDYDRKEMYANFNIDRTRWNILYNSKAITNIQDRIISDEIKFRVRLLFK